MRHSRGMGDINPKKIDMIRPKKITRKDSPERIDAYKGGGKVKRTGIKTVDHLSRQPNGANSIGKPNKVFAEGGESKVNAAGNYTKPELRKRIVSAVKSSATQGTGAGQWSARKAQLVAKKYKAAGGGYK